MSHHTTPEQRAEQAGHAEAMLAMRNKPPRRNERRKQREQKRRGPD